MIYFVLALAHAEETIWIEGESSELHDFQNHSWFNNVNQDLLSPGIPGVIEGDWLVHYRMGAGSPNAQAAYAFDVTEGGSYEIWLRVLTPYTKGWISLDSGNQIELHIDDTIREVVNLIWPSPYTFHGGCGVGDFCSLHHMIGWVKAGEFELSAGTHSITYGVENHAHWDSGSVVGGLDAIAIFNHSWAPSGAVQPVVADTEPGAADWFAFHPKDSPSDWSQSVFYADLEAPAGNHGSAQQQGADVIFEDGTPVKFWGVGASPPGNEDLMRQQASFLSGMGVNLVRRHTVQGTIGNPIDADSLDHFDKWFSILKEHGIYMQWSVFYPHRITEEDGYPLFSELSSGKLNGLVTVFPELQAYEWQYLQQVMNHVNPYTGLKYADDPALAIVEVRNEDSVFFGNPLNRLNNYPQHTAILKADWAAWLTDKYGTDEALTAAWGAGMRNSDSLSNSEMGVYGAWEMAADGPSQNADEAPRMGDWIEFLAVRQCDGYKNRRDLLRGAGYKGIVLSTGWKVGGVAADLANLWTDDCLEMIDRHTYQGGGENIRGGVIITGDDDEDGIAGEVSQGNSHEIPGTSRGILQWSHMQVEGKPMQHSEWIASAPSPWKADAVPTYGFYGMGLYGWDAGLNFTVTSKFSYWGGWPSLTLWTVATPHHLGQYPAISRAVREGHLLEGTPAHAERFASEDIFTGKDERVDYDPWLGAVGPLVKSFEGGSTETVDLETYRDGDFINSNTGELSWNTNGWYKIQAQKSQGIVGKAGPNDISLPDVEVQLTTEFVSLLFTSLDGNPIATSSSILITAMAQDKQTGTIYNADQTQILELGGPPLLMEPVQATLTFSGEPIIAVKILDEHGIPIGDVEDVTDNTIAIDGRWKTAWYQVQRAVPEEPEDTGNPENTDDETDTVTNTDAENTNTEQESADTEETSEASPTKDAESGCGCAASTSKGGWIWLMGVLGLAWRRRNEKRNP